MKFAFFGKKKNSGRNHRGVITIRFRGGGNKRLHRFLNLKRSFWKNQIYKIAGYLYDPFRSVKLIVLFPVPMKYEEKPRLMLSYQGSRINILVINNLLGFTTNAEEILASYCALKNFPIGSFVFNIETTPALVGKLCRSAGTFSQIVEYIEKKNKCILRLPSGKLLIVNASYGASLGIVGNKLHALKKLDKAGQNRWRGKKPHVRGVAINPVDHAHGGGEGKGTSTRGGVNPWGRAIKGLKTKYKNK